MFRVRGDPLTPEKNGSRIESSRMIVWCLSKNDFDERSRTKLARILVLQADRFGTHFRLNLKIIDWKMSAFIEIDRLCTCSLVTPLSLSALPFHSTPFRCRPAVDTDGMKRRFIVKINKRSINLRRLLYQVGAITAPRSPVDKWRI